MHYDVGRTVLYEPLGYKITDEKLDHVGHKDYIMVKDLTGGN